MAANMETPAKLAAQVVADIKQGAESVLDACSKIAAAYDAIEEGGAWTEKQFIDFIDRLSEAGIGPGSNVFIKKDTKGIETFQATAKAGVYYQLMSVGRCEAFKTTEFKKLNKTASYSVLYRLSVLFNHYNEKYSGSKKQKNDRAHKAVLDLVETNGIELSRRIVDKAIVSAQAQRRSFSPIEKEEDNSKRDKNIPFEYQGKVSLDNLIQEEKRYDLVLMTPSEEQLKELKDYSLSDIADMAPYQELRRPKSKAVLIGTGRQLEGLKSLAQATGDLNFVYLIRESTDKKAIINLSDEMVVFTSCALDESSPRKRNETAVEYVRRLVDEDAQGRAKKLHLFAVDKSEGWDSCEENDSWLADAL